MSKHLQSVAHNVIAAIIFTALSTLIVLMLQALGFNTQVAVKDAIFVLLALVILWIIYSLFHEVLIRKLTELMLESVLNVNEDETNQQRTRFKKKIIDRVQKEIGLVTTLRVISGLEYQNQRACEDKIVEACVKSRKIKILTIRGERYFAGNNSILYKPCLAKRESGSEIKVLVLSAEAPHLTDENAKALEHDSAEEIRGKMRSAHSYLQYLTIHNRNFRVRYYNNSPNFKLLIFDNIMFITAIVGSKNDDRVKMFQISKEDNPLFTGFERYFDSLWESCELKQGV